MQKYLFYTSLMLVVILSCHEDEEVINTPPVAVDSTLTVNLSGYVQKGPFINGTAITISGSKGMMIKRRLLLPKEYIKRDTFKVEVSS